MMVHDNGRGIGKDYLPHIFEPYFTTKELGRGTGLGLSIVYSIVRQLGGSVAAYSHEGVETSFSVFLPLLGEAGEEKPS
jgi:signal transduction histidine kinase